MNATSSISRHQQLSNSQLFDQELFKIPLRESKEPMISLSDLFKEHATPVLFNFEKTIVDEPKIFYLRKSVAHSLLKVANMLLSCSYILRIEDAYRSLKYQQKKFRSRV